MKIIIDIPNEKVKSIAATVALSVGETISTEQTDMIDSTPEVDITDEIESDPDTKNVITAFALIAFGKLTQK